MKCMNCGAKINEGIVFCTQCGTKVPEAHVPFVAPAPSTQPAAVQEREVDGTFQGTLVEDLSGEGYSIEERPAFSILTLELPPEQAVLVDSRCVTAMTTNIDIQQRVDADHLKTTLRSVYTARGGKGQLMLAPSLPGDIVMLQLRGDTYIVQNSAILAADPAMHFSSDWDGSFGLVSGDASFMVQVTGIGRLFLSGFGPILRRSLQIDENLVVTLGHIVAFQATLQNMAREESWAKKSAVNLSHRSIVVEFSGPGEIYLQTRTPEGIAAALTPFLR